jgi:hypothetical protein
MLVADWTEGGKCALRWDRQIAELCSEFEAAGPARRFKDSRLRKSKRRSENDQNGGRFAGLDRFGSVQSLIAGPEQAINLHERLAVQRMIVHGIDLCRHKADAGHMLDRFETLSVDLYENVSLAFFRSVIESPHRDALDAITNDPTMEILGVISMAKGRCEFRICRDIDFQFTGFRAYREIIGCPFTIWLSNFVEMFEGWRYRLIGYDGAAISETAQFLAKLAGIRADIQHDIDLPIVDEVYQIWMFWSFPYV